MLLEEEGKRKTNKKKFIDYGPKIFIKDSIRTGKNIETFRFTSVR